MSGAYGLFGKWLISGQLKISEGDISLLGQRVAMLPTSFFVEMEKTVQKSNSPTLRDDVYLWAWKIAYLYIKKFVEEYGLKTFEERYKWGMDIASLAGFGDYKTIDYHDKEYSYFYIINNPIAEAFYPSKKAVDTFLRGINAGGGTACHMQIVNCLETDCQAINGQKCVFITGTERAHEKFGVSDLYAEQLDLDYVLPQQKEFLRKVGLPKV